MLSTYRDSSPHHAAQLDLPANIRSTSQYTPGYSGQCTSVNSSSGQCTSVYSTNNGSVQTSPVFEEEEEERENGGETPTDKTQFPPVSPLATAEITSPTGRSGPPAILYETQSLPRRRKGGGLVRTLSLYQENRRQTTTASSKTKKPIERGQSLDVANNTGMYMHVMTVIFVYWSLASFVAIMFCGIPL